MYMTRVFLKRLPPPNIIHGILSAALPGERCNKDNICLWRVDKINDDHALIIVSSKSPDIERIVTEIGKKADSNKLMVHHKDNKTIDYSLFLSKLQNNQVWKFRLCANPIENKKQQESDKRGKVYALRTINEQLKWLAKQGEKNGFKILGSAISNDSWIIFRDVRIRAITFDGTLSILDADSLRAALSHGIGRGKAFGCGLLTIVRAQYA